MCGIIAGVGEVNLIPTGLEMLKNLEYRGYDSAGIAYFEKGEIFAQKCIGGVDKLKECCAFNIDSNVMIGHTRWATHGKVCLQNAQPIIQNNIALVHNGIFENYKEFAYEFVKKLILAWDPDFTKVTPEEAKAISAAEESDLPSPVGAKRKSFTLADAAVR